MDLVYFGFMEGCWEKAFRGEIGAMSQVNVHEAKTPLSQAAYKGTGRGRNCYFKSRQTCRPPCSVEAKYEAKDPGQGQRAIDGSR